MLHVKLSRVALIVLTGATLAAAPRGTDAPQAQEDEWCRESGRGDRGWFCEVREFTLSAEDAIRVDASPNGGIAVWGSDRDDVLVRARVSARARTDDDAMEIVEAVDVDVSGTSVEADGPRTGRRESWSVSYRIYAPSRSDLSLESTNGGITIEDVTGDLDFRTTNGGIHLTGVGGDVRGRTTNGGVHVVLDGTSWSGAGLDVTTQNGGVHLTVPEGYSAHLETGTVNGGLDFDFPVTVQGRLNRRSISMELGSGGNPIRVRTTNGGVTVRRP
jgi:hypothetical protein